MRSVGICGSDLLYVELGSQRILGHELAGVTADGTAVAVEAIYGCMACEHCLDGAYNLCPTHVERALGATADGGMAERFLAPSARLVPLPAALPVADACLVEPATVAWHALRLGRTGPDTSVAVVGAGALGLLAVAGARRMGAGVVALDARHDHQRSAGERLGATIGASGRFDVVIEAAGTAGGLARATELVAPRGVVVVLGVHLGTIELPWSALFHREAAVIPSLGYCAHGGRREMDDAAAMLAETPEIADTVITHRFPLAEATEAFRVAGDRAGGAIRVVVEP